ncbi:MAG TPA: RusA family crossover junction endodeoxyribonuclease [Bradyrhizobium sp.]|jgi:Holliday junction resolvase RusA-like endonuclease|nr:RusA family crossover junction endodeoxyribonuclease [Bradyrhizobium sp.]
MTDAVTITINGEVVAKGRTRMTRRGFVYTPTATRKYEAHARLAAQVAMGDRAPLQIPVRVELAVELPVPTSWSNKRRLAALAGAIAPTSKPDIDNYVKMALDAINTIVVTDDALVVEIQARKRFSEQPKLTAIIIPLDVAASNSRIPQREAVAVAQEV